MLVNLALRPIARRIDRQPSAAAEVEYTYELRATTRGKHEATVRAHVVQALRREGFHMHALRSEDLEDDDRVGVYAILTTIGQDQSLMEEAVSRLSLLPIVTTVSWETIDPSDDERPADSPVHTTSGVSVGLRRLRRAARRRNADDEE
ncbi:MAG: hypothetical protein PVSMB7_21830 [Chloroflexota bacterium]